MKETIEQIAKDYSDINCHNGMSVYDAYQEGFKVAYELGLMMIRKSISKFINGY